MAEQVEKKAPKKGGFFSKVSPYFREIKSEGKKVVWPNRKQTLNNSVVVLVVVGSVGVFIWILDWILTLIRGFILGF